MIPKINIKYLENDIYSVTPTNKINAQISYIDFNYSPPPAQTLNLSSSSAFGTVSPNVYIKNIQLKKMEFSIYIRSIDYNNTQEIFNHVKNEINKDAYRLITDLGEKNRINAPSNLTNFDISEIKKKYNYDDSKISRNIISKLNVLSSYVATQGRIGSVNYMTSNMKTYKYILNNLSSEHIQFDTNGVLMIGSFKYLVDNLVDDDIIILGRKNKSDLPGVHCRILTDENGDILFHEILSPHTFSQQTNFIMYYGVFDIGINPEYQYMKINSRTLAYYRAKKLQRIKELYGN